MEKLRGFGELAIRGDWPFFFFFFFFEVCNGQAVFQFGRETTASNVKSGKEEIETSVKVCLFNLKPQPGWWLSAGVLRVVCSQQEHQKKKTLSALEPELFIELFTRTFKFSVTDTDPDANFCSNDSRGPVNGAAQHRIGLEMLKAAVKTVKRDTVGCNL